LAWCNSGEAVVKPGRAGQAVRLPRRQLDDRIIAQRRDGFQAHVTAALNCPFVVLFEQQCADQACDRVLVGEDADHIGAPLDLAVEAFKLKASTSVSASSISAASFGTFGAQLIGDRPPLLARGLGVLLHEGRADEGRYHAPALAAGMRQYVAHEVDPAALPGGI
jgi:hypothetical protein